MKPICTCFADKDSKVQLAACDAIYNVIKNYREEVLKNELFDRIFASTITLISSPVEDVKKFAKATADVKSLKINFDKL